jgi:CheY-like chemotaxis protein
MCGRLGLSERELGTPAQTTNPTPASPPATSDLRGPSHLEAHASISNAPPPQRPRRIHPGGVERDLSGVRVLVADDSDISLDVTQRILELHGAVVWVAHDGRQALDLLRVHHDALDVLLMDVQMPVLDGHATAQLIRGELGLLDLPIIALTAGVLSSERRRAVAAGMDDCIVKPFDTRNLVEAVRRGARRETRRTAAYDAAHCPTR